MLHAKTVSLKSIDASWTDSYLADYQKCSQKIGAPPVTAKAKFQFDIHSITPHGRYLLVNAGHDTNSNLFTTGYAMVNGDGTVHTVGCRRIRPKASVLGSELEAICMGMKSVMHSLQEHVTVLSNSLDAKSRAEVFRSTIRKRKFKMAFQESSSSFSDILNTLLADRVSFIMSMAKQHHKFKILMFPWLAHGHIHPFLQLSKKLSKTNFTIYFCSTAINLDSNRSSVENELSDDDPWIKLVELQIPSSPDLPPHLHTTKNLPSNLIPALLQAFQKSSSSFSDILNSAKPDLLIYDIFQPWAPKMASSKGVPSVYFSTSGATPFSYYHHVHTMGSASTFPYKAIRCR
ncbi:hypothetical protein ACS0TY_014529 [Phlomoides rotata]